jgi:hypothetical protein
MVFSVIVALLDILAQSGELLVCERERVAQHPLPEITEAAGTAEVLPRGIEGYVGRVLQPQLPRLLPGCNT